MRYHLMQVAVKNRLQGMDEYDFEHFVADLWEQMGWECEVSQASADAGIDVIATKSNPYPQKKLIQAKRYGPNTTVGGPDIQQYASLKQQESNVDSVVVVTTGSFTRAAEKRAEELNVKLVDGDRLVSMVDDLEVENLMEQYDISTSTGPQSHTGGQDRQSYWGDIAPEESSGGLLVKIEGKRDWHRVLLKTTGLAIGLFFVGGFLLNTNIGFLEAIGNIIVFAWAVSIIAVAVFLYLDIRHVRRRSSWEPTTWQYLLGLIVFYVTIPLYFYRRRKAVGS